MHKIPAKNILIDIKLQYFLHLLLSMCILDGALFLQYAKGLAPCPLCLWQRYGYGVVGILALMGMQRHRSWLLWGIGFAYLVTASIALYQVGLEQQWWQGVTACSSALQGQSVEAILAQLQAAPLVRCDDIKWQFLGLSLAGWNAIIGFMMAITTFLLKKSSLLSRIFSKFY